MSGREKRRCHSVKRELIAKSREAMLAAVQIYNNPNSTFKTEAFIALSVISWTYLLHAYYRDKKIDYRYCKSKDKPKRYDKTKGGSYKYWNLEKCLNEEGCPLEEGTKANLKFLIDIRHEVEHRMAGRLDDDENISSKIQACAINFSDYINKLFGDKYRVDRALPLAIQFSALSLEQQDNLLNNPHISPDINKFIVDFESRLPDDVKASTRYACRIFIKKISAKREGQANKVLEVIPRDSPLAEGLEKEQVIFNDREKPKYRPGQIVDMMKEEGYPKFSMQKHTELWQQKNAKGDSRYGAYVSDGGPWYWYSSWIDVVRKYCQEHRDELQ